MATFDNPELQRDADALRELAEEIKRRGKAMAEANENDKLRKLEPGMEYYDNYWPAGSDKDDE